MRKLRNSELNRVSTKEFKRLKKLPLMVALDDVRSMHNVGSVFRTADAFAVEKLFLGGISPIPPHGDIEKTALGATESVDWEHVSELIDKIKQIKSTGYRVVGFEHTTTSKNLKAIEIDLNDKYLLVFGNEVKGISNAVLAECDEIVEIPQLGTKHSLNISVSAGIGIWEFAKHWI